ncbi:nucleoside-diphosphate sugar epimerase/dehydratase [Polynucleobacter sp. MG-6-Vaara-E2]|uniref:polysaccharide biosynthesis protein n=1 Tax=Polynucleobacter sp. MG-6-Vaara-E2 TaxID=2576932 RepID=UPI001BFD54EC|nr:nucleoside-diphosphate sugar epimerase/dehydratase [Polynucleobacter sp. MG-6-Vaara-E2]QWD96932.1 polysaccharide biosynthesis protein [Polynucleobacter sp. MG-6-Vaara-E2]
MKINALITLISLIPRRFKRICVLFVDISLSGLTFWYSIYLLSGNWLIQSNSQWLSMAFEIIVSTAIFYCFGLYNEVFRYIGSAAFKSTVRAFIYLFCTALIVFTLIGVEDVPRSIGIIQPILLFCAIGSFRYLIRFIFSYSRSNIERKKKSILIFGAGQSGRQLLASLNIDKNIIVKGFVDDDTRLQGNFVNGICVYSCENLKALIDNLAITDLILAMPSSSRSRRLEVINALEGCGVRVRTLPSVVSFVTGQINLADLHDLEMPDLLGRNEVLPDPLAISHAVSNKVILVTGAGGSIGSELCRQILALSPKELILVDSCEFNLYTISSELKVKCLPGVNLKLDGAHPESDSIANHTKIFSYLLSIRDINSIKRVFSRHCPDTVFHAAAYKHVPLVEENAVEGIRNNVFGTKTIAELSMASGVRNFTLVSTDKAVRPTNVMGATKRISELILQSLAESVKSSQLPTIFSMVRFGNVLGSSGSVAPLFVNQIKNREPITITHPDVTRYFMSISEAAQLVLQASSMSSGGEVFILDMGAPVRIYDLALKMIYLSGLTLKDELHPDGDIEIKFIGLRPGEKLFEELLIGNDPQPTKHAKILKGNESFIPLDKLNKELKALEEILESNDLKLVYEKLKNLVPEYIPNVTA